VSAGVIRGEVDIDTATQKMIARGMRSLLVVDEQDHVTGIITSRDLIGDRPYDAMNKRGVPFADVRVNEVMTTADHIEVIPSPRGCRAGDIVAALSAGASMRSSSEHNDRHPPSRHLLGVPDCPPGIAMQRETCRIERAITRRDR
jgi:CBS domain containing-hemolysin-like protein